MALTSNFTRQCVAYSGGVNRLWLVDKADVTSFTLSGGQYTAVTMVSGKVFKEFEFLDDTCSVRENSSRNEQSGAIMIDRELEFYLQGMSNTHRASLQEIIDSSTCGVIAIVLDNNSTYWVHGYNEKSKRALKLKSGNVDFGKNLDDNIGATVILGNKNNEFSRVFTGTVPTS